MRRTFMAALLFVGMAVTTAIIVMTGVFIPKPISQAAEPGKKDAAAKPAAPQLPVSQVILFSSGVGYFQREGQVDGNARIDLSFPVQNVNDLLKSMVLQDLGGGKISTVNYDSSDPVEKTLRSFALNLTGNPSLGNLFNQARGEKVEVVLQQSEHTQAGTFTGSLVGVEFRKQAANIKEAVVDVEFLNLSTAEGLRSFRLADLQRLRFLNPVTEREFNHALEVLAKSHDTQKKTVSLGFTGNGKRQVRVGYVVENPIWKTSYRLVLDKKGKPFLQGWAMVENTSDEDWKDVRMALVSGRPISFQMNLYQPLYVPRPVEEPELFASLRPQTYSGAIFDDSRKLGANQGKGADLLAETPSFATTPRPESPFTGAEKKPEGARRESGDNFLRGRMELQKGVASAATATALGDFFQYIIDEPVSLPRQKSAMLPIVNKEIEGTRVSIYNEGTLAKYPRLGLKFKNTTGLHLMQGPITIFEGSSYAGDTRILDLQPNEERLVSYAIDLGTEVNPVAKREPDKLLSVKIDKGILVATNKIRESKTYNLKNRSEQERSVLIEHPFRADYKLVSKEMPAETARDFYRFEVKVPAGKTVSQTVTEERDFVQQVALTDHPDQTIRIFLTSNVTSEKVQAALKRALELKGKLEMTRGERNRMNNELNVITQEQGRLRANMGSVAQNSTLFKRYQDKLNDQETKIEKLQEKMMTLDETSQQQEKEFRSYLSNLNVE